MAAPDCVISTAAATLPHQRPWQPAARRRRSPGGVSSRRASLISALHRPPSLCQRTPTNCDVRPFPAAADFTSANGRPCCAANASAPQPLGGSAATSVCLRVIRGPNPINAEISKEVRAVITSDSSDGCGGAARAGGGDVQLRVRLCIQGPPVAILADAQPCVT